MPALVLSPFPQGDQGPAPGNPFWRLLEKLTWRKARAKVRHFHTAKRDVDAEVAEDGDAWLSGNRFGVEPGAHDRLVKIDLERQWQQSRRPLLETYLQSYPELGTPHTVALGLIQAEYEVRQQFGFPADLEDFARRFPRQEVALRRLVAPTQDVAPAAELDRSGKVTPGPLASTPSQAQPLPASPSLPEHFGRYQILRRRTRYTVFCIFRCRRFPRSTALEVAGMSLSSRNTRALSRLGDFNLSLSPLFPFGIGLGSIAACVWWRGHLRPRNGSVQWGHE